MIGKIIFLLEKNHIFLTNLLLVQFSTSTSTFGVAVPTPRETSP